MATISDTYLAKARLATQAIFLVCGLGMSSWAPLVPYVKDKLHLNNERLGVLLLFLGVGAIVVMPVTGFLILRLGTRKVMAISGITMAIVLASLLLVQSSFVLAILLFMFGASIGSIDVAMNTHGIQVQNLLGKTIMSSLHGLFSVGGLVGPLVVGFLIKSGLTPLLSVCLIAALLIVMIGVQYKNLMNIELEKQIISKFSSEVNTSQYGKVAWLHPKVIFLGALCFAVFLSEGAMLDWGAIFLRDNKGVEEALSGIGYAAFSIAMAFVRLIGDSIVSKLASKWVVLGGCLIGFIGFVCLVFSPCLSLVLVGFVLIGIGAANIVPIFFSQGGQLKDIPSTVALSAITTMGYGGQLAGPAILGFIAQQTSLSMAFSLTGILLLLVGAVYFFRSN